MRGREETKKGCQRGKREREDGEAVTQEMEREWGRESDDGGGGGSGVGAGGGGVGVVAAQPAMRATAAWALK